MTDTILWDKCLNAFNSVLSEKQMRTWFHPLEVIRKDKTLNVVAPNEFVKDVIENDFLLLIKDTVLSESSNQVSEILLSLPTPQKTQRSESGSAATKPQILGILKKLVPTIQKSYFQVAVEGHTDSKKTSGKVADRYPTNWELSSARASSVVRVLKNFGVNSTKLQAVGFADNVPRDRSTMELITEELIKKYNSTKVQRDRNRRVEITFLAPHGGPVGRGSKKN